MIFKAYHKDMKNAAKSRIQMNSLAICIFLSHQDAYKETLFHQVLLKESLCCHTMYLRTDIWNFCWFPVLSCHK